MKRCPECRRDYYDDTLLYCLEDGNALVQGAVSLPDEPQTAILSEFGVRPSGGSGSEPGAVATGFRGSEDRTRPFIHTTEAEAEPRGSLGGLTERPSLSAHRAAKPLLAIGMAIILLVGGFFGYRYLRPAATGAINSIAVLPFENKSGNADSDYLSDGVAESLIYKLSQLPNLKVSPRSSVFRYKGKEIDVEKIGAELGVDAVMSGRIIQRGDNLTISVDLVDVRNKKSLWGEQYERKMSELLATQREIAAEITNKLQLKLSGDSAQKLAKKYTDNNEAYQFYLKGRFHFARRTHDDILKGIDYFQQAIQLDPNFALAYAMIAESHISLPAFNQLSPKEAIPQAKAGARRAVEIDPTLAEGHTFLAYTLAAYDWNWAEAEREFKRAIDLDPNGSTPHLRYGQIYLSPVGRHAEAIAEVKRAMELEPLSVFDNSVLTATYFFARQQDRALDQGKKTSDLDPNFPTGRWTLGCVYNASGMYAEAIALSEKSLESDPTNQVQLGINGYAYARSGRRREAEAVISKFREIGKTQYASPYWMAVIYAGLGDKDKAFAELERAFTEVDWNVHRLKVDPLMDGLRDDPRFAVLLKRLNLPE